MRNEAYCEFEVVLSAGRFPGPLPDRIQQDLDRGPIPGVRVSVVDRPLPDPGYEVRPIPYSDPARLDRITALIRHAIDRVMAETVELPSGMVADRGPWEGLLRLVAEKFPDPSGDEGEEAEIRADITNELARGGSAYRLGKEWGLDPDELRKLRECDEAAALCNIRPRE